MNNLPVVAVVGRVNVGKSTLFNRIAGSRIAIVDDQPGVTRDRNMALAQWCGYDFIVIDTGGLAPGSEDVFQEGIERQVRLAVTEADAVILVTDVSTGIHPFDEEAANLVRRADIPAFVAVNKADNVEKRNQCDEFYSLGLGEPYPVSALHGTGTGDLLDAVTAVLPEKQVVVTTELAVAIVGRPNVGKSSLVNRLCREDRNIVTDTPGTTRDSIDTVVAWNEQEFRIIDTAGLRRKSKKMDDIEFYSTVRAWKTMARSDVTVILMDAGENPVSQDIRILAKAWEMGKGVVIVVNKIDLGIDRKKWLEKIMEKFHPAKWIPIVFTSALEGEGVGRLLPIISNVGAKYGIEMSTSKINRILEKVTQKIPPPSPRGKQLKFFYATQLGTKPPKILVFVNRPGEIPDNYRKYLLNAMMDIFGMKGVPLRLLYRRREH